MRRRDFITLVGGTAVAWPLTARAQQATPVIGFLSSISPDRQAPMTRGYLQGLSETGFIEGRNVTIEYRWASGQYDQLPAMVADLIARRVSVIDAVAGSAPGLAAKAATTTIPIVFQTGSDPIKDGLVSSINRPAGNITGVTRLGTTVEPRRLELLHEVVPNAPTISFLVNPANPAVDHQLQEVQDAAKSLGLNLDVLKASTEGELLGVFENLSKKGSAALLIATDPFFDGGLLLTLAARYRVPIGHFDRNQVAAVDQGIVQSLDHPGANITGFTYMERTIGAKWFGLLMEVAPQVKSIAFIFNPKAAPYAHFYYESAAAAAETRGVRVEMAPVTELAEIERAFANIGSGAGMIVNPDAFTIYNQGLIIDLAARHRVPAIYGSVGGVAKLGALIVYNLDLLDNYRQAGRYVQRILKGENPADLPVQQPTKFQLAINLKTANALGLTVPPLLLATADEVIE